MPAHVPSRWSPDGFKQGSWPSVVGMLTEPDVFSQRGPEPIRVLDMCIKMPDTNWTFPPYIRQFSEAITKAIYFEKPLFENSTGMELQYCYITIDQKPVPPYRTQRRPGWHSDAYVVDKQGQQVDIIAENAHLFPWETEWVERTYVVCDALPTLFAFGPWELPPNPNDCDAVLKAFDVQARRMNKIEATPYVLYCLDPYCVHTAQSNLSDRTIDRTFIKIQFSAKRYNRVGNTINPDLSYKGWEWVERDADKREHRYA